MRAAIYARISRVTERTTSVERQIKAAESLCEQREWIVAGTYPDEGVSGATAPDERPQMGKMLRRLDELDAIVFYRIDRLARSTVAFADLMDRCQRAGVALVSVTEPMDLSTPMGRAMAEITSVFAKLEREMMRERIMDARADLKEAGKFTGGRIHFGLKPVPHSSGKGRVLARDATAVPILKTMRDILVSGGGKADVARWMTKERVLTAAQRVKVRGEDEPEPVPSRWWAESVGVILRNPQLLGHRLLPDGRVETDEEGMPVRVWEPVFTLAEWDELQAALDRDAAGPRKNRHDSHWLRPFARCGVCGGRMATSRSHGRMTLRCGRDNMRRHVPSPSVRMDELEPWVLESLREDFGYLRLARQVWVGGADHRDERETVRRAIERLRADREDGLYDGPDDEAAFRSQMGSLIARRRALSELPDVPGYWESQDTGETVSEALRARPGSAGDLMRMAGLVVRVHPGAGRGRTTLPAGERAEIDWEDPEAAHAEDFSD